MVTGVATPHQRIWETVWKDQFLKCLYFRISRGKPMTAIVNQLCPLLDEGNGTLFLRDVSLTGWEYCTLKNVILTFLQRCITLSPETRSLDINSSMQNLERMICILTVHSRHNQLHPFSVETQIHKLWCQSYLGDF